jgi:hypothetical protein
LVAAVKDDRGWNGSERHIRPAPGRTLFRRAARGPCPMIADSEAGTENPQG